MDPAPQNPAPQPPQAPQPSPAPAPQTPEFPVFIASDHRGFDLKNNLVKQFGFTDLGPSIYDEDDDFNDAALNVSREVLRHPNARGIIICGSAHGVVIQANRIKGIRAIAAYNEDLAKIGRQHNDANVLCLSNDFVEPQKNVQIIEAFLTTPFLNKPRYQRRIARLDNFDKGVI